MARDVSAAAQAAFEADHVRYAIFFEGRFDSGTIYLWSGLGNFDYDGNTYTGAGTLVSLGAMRESSDLRNDSTTIELSGLPTEMVSLALGEDYQGRKVIVRIGYLDDAGGVISAVQIVNGFADQMRISEDGETASIQLAVESEVARFERRSLRRYTSAGLKSIHPEDRGLEFVAGLTEKDIRWGGKKSGGGESKSPTAPVEFDNNPQGR